jgi:outer membrane biogenesis lipoprotein LolB
MKTRTPLLLVAPVTLLMLVGCKPTGPVTARELTALTNAVQKVTTNAIIRIDHVDAETRMAVTTTNQQNYLFERTSFGWKYIPAIKP